MDTPVAYRLRAQFHVMRFWPRWLLCMLLLLPLAAAGQSAAGRDALIIDELTCRGNLATSCDFILGHIYLSAGDIVDEEELGNARLRLSTLPSFDSINIYLERGIARGHVRVVVEVVEADPYLRQWLAGTSWRVDSVSQMLAGRITHQNLFGTGKLLDLIMVAYVPVEGRKRGEYAGRLQYVDPHLLNNKRMYLIAGMSGGRADATTINDARWETENLGFDVAVGRRIFDFSFLSIGYRYNAYARIDLTRRLLDGTVENFNANTFDNHVVSAAYGWNSEDDPYFPTRGSRAVLNWSWISTAGDRVTNGGIRKTWTTANGTSWVLQAADTPGTEYRSFVDEHFDFVGGFARPIGASADGEIRRGRWYVEAGYTPQGHSLRGERQKEYGLKIGVRLQTRSFGMVDLYVIGSALHTDRSAQ